MPGFYNDHICHACVGDRFLKAEIKAEGTRAICMACGMRRPAFTVPDLARRVDEAICEQFAPVRNDDGYNFETLVEENALVSSEIAETLTGYLSSTAGYRAVRDGEDNVYDSCVSWDDGPLDRSRYQSGWARFQESIKQEARYYNGYADQWLDDVFLSLDRQADWAGEKVISTWMPSKTRPPFVRGRVAQSDEELKKFLTAPAKELGPPPSAFATAGRMNAAGVSVFYGAMDVETCRAETRPPVGSNIVFASFRLVRAVRLLDLDALARIAVKGSIFDADYMHRLERAAFLRRLDDEVSRPVMPRDEAFGYLPTQVVAEYLAQRSKLDGLIYRSTQAGESHSAHGQRPRNIVLFQHAARVGDDDPGRVEIDVDLGWADDEDADDSITIREKKLPPQRKKDPLKKKPGVIDFEWAEPEPEPRDWRRVTLRFLPDSLIVHRVRATDYKVDERDVTRFRYSDAEMDKWRF